MKYQTVFSEKKKKRNNVLFAENFLPSMLSVKRLSVYLKK